MRRMLLCVSVLAEWIEHFDAKIELTVVEIFREDSAATVALR